VKPQRLLFPKHVLAYN